MPSVREELEGFVAGRVKAERVVAAVAAAYYSEGKREAFKPLMEIIERAHPGVVQLSATSDGAGFAVQLAERPFPKGLEVALRNAASVVLGAQVDSPPAGPGFWARAVQAIRRLFSAST